MNRREFFFTAASAFGTASLIATLPPSGESCACRDAAPVHLYEVQYDFSDEPYVYSSTSAEAALAAYRYEVGPNEPQLTLDDVTELRDDEPFRFVDDNGDRCVELAGVIAAAAPRDTCIFCDPYYC